MEQEKNNAKEKVEKVEKNVQKENSDKIKKDNEQKRAKERVKNARLKKEKEALKEREKKIKKERKEQEKKLKQEKKEREKNQKEKIKIAKKQEKERLLREKRDLKEQLKEEKREKKLALKNETKEEKRARISAIKQEKARQRQQKRNLKKNKGSIGGWLAAVISLGTACLALVSVLTFYMMGDRRFSSNDFSYSYRQNFSDLVDYVDNIDVNLCKVLASSDEREQQKLFGEISSQSQLAEHGLQNLPISYENKYNTAKFINQLGDYSKYLNNRLIDGFSITEEEYSNVEMLYERNVILKNNLLSINNEIKGGAKIEELFKNGDSFGVKTFAEMENQSLDYPQLIYDGPFSDGLTNREVKGLTGEKISSTEAEEKFKNYFEGYALNTFEFLGEVNGQYEGYNFRAQDENGVEVFAQISKKGGKLLNFNYSKECKEGSLSERECIANGEKFLKSLGIRGMKAVWAETNGYMTTVNYAYEQDGVIYYSDLIKLNICREKGQVFGMEARNYYLNHTERKDVTFKLSKNEALLKVNSDMEIESVRKAVVPFGTTSEKACWEVAGEINGSKYYIYVDALNGREVNIFKVVETDEGNLLL